MWSLPSSPTAASSTFSLQPHLSRGPRFPQLKCLPFRKRLMSLFQVTFIPVPFLFSLPMTLGQIPGRIFGEGGKHMLKSMPFLCQGDGMGAWELQVSLREQLALLGLRWRFPLAWCQMQLRVSQLLTYVCPRKAGSFFPLNFFLFFPLFNQTKPICSCQLHASAPSKGKSREQSIFLV